MTDRSAEMLIGILAILKCGGSYLPVSPQYPRERIRYILADAAVSIALLEESVRDQKESIEALGVAVEMIVPPLELTEIRTTGVITENPANPGGLAYIMYTSGSTGHPKGVMVEHRNVVRLVRNTNYIDFASGSRILQTGVPEFDASTFEMWGCLLNGLTLCLIPRDHVLSPQKLKTAIQRFDIDIMWMTSPLFNQLTREDIDIFKGLRHLLVGGDVLSPPCINRVREGFPHLDVINGYGPTENTTFSTTYPIEREFQSAIPIGSPIANSLAVVVDTTATSPSLLPAGVFGELWVGGDGLARGYLNNPELTAQRFVPLTEAAGLAGHRFYRTGDMARFFPDGTIEFRGRVDNQIKIRGFRVETGEIEAALMGHELVKEALVLVKRDQRDEKFLCAYIVPAPLPTHRANPLDSGELTGYLGNKLPDHMLPSGIVFLDRFPLNKNGKIDREALPEPNRSESGGITPPANRVEQELAAIWQEVLGIDRVGVHQNFFLIGGHSLRAIVLISKIQQTFKVELPLTQLFSQPTIRETADYIANSAGAEFHEIEAEEQKEYYPLSSAQKRLFFLDHLETIKTSYNMPTVVKVEGNLDIPRFRRALRALVRRHEVLRTSFGMIEGKPAQQIHPPDSVGIDIPLLPETDETREAVDALLAGFIRPFDLAQAPLIRAAVIPLASKSKGTGNHLVVIDMHHIISDGTSNNVILGELTQLYDVADLPPLGVQYKDFSVWQNRLLDSGVIRRQTAYWHTRFEDAAEIPPLDLPCDFPRPEVFQFDGDTAIFQVESTHAATLRRIAGERGTTLYMTLLTIFNILLYKYTGQRDIVVGCVVAGRRHAALQKIIGMFVNTLAMRNNPNGSLTFLDFLEQIKHTSL
jgi:tyrocidine synthetase-3